MYICQGNNILNSIWNEYVTHFRLNRCEAAAKAAGKVIGTVTGIRQEEKDDLPTKSR